MHPLKFQITFILSWLLQQFPFSFGIKANNPSMPPLSAFTLRRNSNNHRYHFYHHPKYDARTCPIPNKYSKYDDRLKPWVLHTKDSDHDDPNSKNSNYYHPPRQTRKEQRPYPRKNKSKFSKYYDKDHRKYTNSRERSISKGRDPIISLNMNLDSLAKSKERGSAERAEQLLVRIEKLYELGYYDERPDVVSYNAVLNAWARSREHDSAQRAEKLLQKMEELYACGDEELKPNVISFNCVLNAFANSKARGSPERAGEMLHQMNEMYLTGNQDVKPNRVSYHSVMNAYASSRGTGPRSAEKARGILDKMMELYHTESNESLKPNLRTFNTLFKAYANIIDPNIKQKLEEILDLMKQLRIQPDQFTYSSITTAYSKNGEVKAAEDILSHMEDMYRKGNKRMRPNKFIFSAIINAYANQGDAEKAEQMLYKMEIMADEHSTTSSESDEKKALDFKPDVVCYTGVIHAYATSKSMDTELKANKAEELFHRMECLYEEGNSSVKPNIHTCCAVIDALSTDGAYTRAENILLKLPQYNLQPNRATYNALLKALAKSSSVEKAEKAFRLMHKMKEQVKLGNRNLSPDAITYNTVMLCAAYSHGGVEGKRRAMSIALNVFNTFFESNRDKMNTYTFGVFLVACRNLISVGEERLSVVKQVFDLCCLDGKLSNDVIHQIRRTLPPDQWLEVFDSNESFLQEDQINNLQKLSISDLPPEWSQATTIT